MRPLQYIDRKSSCRGWIYPSRKYTATKIKKYKKVLKLFLICGRMKICIKYTHLAEKNTIKFKFFSKKGLYKKDRIVYNKRKTKTKPKKTKWKKV